MFVSKEGARTHLRVPWLRLPSQAALLQGFRSGTVSWWALPFALQSRSSWRRCAGNGSRRNKVVRSITPPHSLSAGPAGPYPGQRCSNTPWASSQRLTCDIQRVSLRRRASFFSFSTTMKADPLMMPATSMWYQGLVPNKWGSQERAACPRVGLRAIGGGGRV